ncbi:uncharacterized protein LOC124168432 [Ischnura elegans]|uniref:uncharacterized protein LOC124168432 n=1 Tax=Ischnura elegans TaxID=197161 RepID=UPI001ED868F6|nr:uncharacterized protein LOC124168432 [Ischnura elegans]
MWMGEMAPGFSHLERKVDALLACDPKRKDATVEEMNFSQLPLTADEDFIKLCHRIGGDPSFEPKLMQCLVAVGGKNERALLQNILRCLISDDVAELYSLTGKPLKNSAKKSFYSTSVCPVIFRVCRRIYPEASDVSLKGCLSDWLNQAKVRKMRKIGRMNKHAEVQADEDI